MLTGGQGFFWQRYTLKTRFANVAGLKPGSPVRVAGVEVGSVNDVDVRRRAGRRRLRGEQERCASGSPTSRSATLGSVSLLGSRRRRHHAVDDRARRFRNGGYVPAGAADGGSSRTSPSRRARTIDEITGLVQDLRAGKGTVGKLMTDDQLYTELQQFVATAGRADPGASSRAAARSASCSTIRRRPTRSRRR